MADHRLSAAWQLSLYGLRRGEVLGLRWSDIDLEAKALTIRRATSRGHRNGDRGGRTQDREGRSHPATGRCHDVRSALAANSAVAGTHGSRDGVLLRLSRLRGVSTSSSTSSATCPARNGSPMSSEGWPRAPACRSIRLHDTRHTCGTLMHLRGVPTAVISQVVRACHGQLHHGDVCTQPRRCSGCGRRTLWLSDSGLSERCVKDCEIPDRPESRDAPPS